MVELFINPELFALVPEPTKEDYIALKKSIQINGQHKPITVWKESVTGKSFIIDGHTRNESCKELNIEPIIKYQEFDGWDSAMLYAIQVNSNRRHLTDMQKVELALREIEIEKKIAEKRQKLTVPKKGEKGFQKLPNGMHTGNTCDIVAAKTGLSSRTVARHKKILDEGSEELKKKVASGKKTVAAAERQINLEKMHTNPISLPDGKFKVILCDVPYKYDLEGQGTPNYPTLEKSEIISLKDKQGRPITDVFADDSIVFFWVPPPKLEEALDILKAWDFSYKTKITWSKEIDGISQKGVGHYIMATCEDILIATKGKRICLEF